MSDIGHWTTDLEIPETFFGFVYLITNNKTNRKYLGKKQAKTMKKYPPLKGKKRHRRIEKDTDWKKYTGSSNELNDDIKENGKEHYTFKILCFCDSKSELAYLESKLQFDYDVLLRDDFINGIVNMRLGRVNFLLEDLKGKMEHIPDIS